MKRVLFLAVFLFSISVSAKTIISESDLPNGFKICFIGDSGTASKAQFMVGRALIQEGCDQVRHLGDVIYSSGLKNAKDRKFFTHFYNPYKTLIEDQNVPFYLVMGNHDHRRDPEVWYEVVSNYKNIHFPHLYYFERHGDICFASIDTNTKFSAQRRFFNSVYGSEGSNCRLSLGMAHHPRYSVGQHGNASWGTKRFLRDVVEGRLDIYLAGHDHNLSYEGQVDGTHHFVSGAAGKLRPLDEDPKPGNYAISAYGYVTMTVERTASDVGMKYEFRVVHSDQNIETTFSGRIDGQGLR